jgi:hypothetical protein
MKQITSSNLASANYDAGSEVLTVTFKNGTSYKYPNVPSKLYGEFEETFSGENGKSAGQFFNTHIKQLPCEKVEE